MNCKSNKLFDYMESLELSHDQDPRFTSNFWRSLQFNISDHMFLNISPMKGVSQFENKDKLSTIGLLKF